MKRKCKSLFVIDAEIPALTKNAEGRLRGGYKSMYSSPESKLNDKKKNDDCNCGCGTTKRPNDLPNGNCNCNCMCTHTTTKPSDNTGTSSSTDSIFFDSFMF